VPAEGEEPSLRWPTWRGDVAVGAVGEKHEDPLETARDRWDQDHGSFFWLIIMMVRPLDSTVRGLAAGGRAPESGPTLERHVRASRERDPSATGRVRTLSTGNGGEERDRTGRSNKRQKRLFLLAPHCEGETMIPTRRG
jgi:hypothetical protein